MVLSRRAAAWPVSAGPQTAASTGAATTAGCQRRMYVTIRRPTSCTVRIAVRDGSRTLPVLMQAGDCDAESGRGLSLVDRLTRGRWGVVPEALGKTTWAELVVGGGGG